MKLNNIFLSITAVASALFFTACEPDYTVIKIKAVPPIVEDFTLENEQIVYGQTPKGSLLIADPEYNLKEVKIDIIVEGTRVFTETIEEIGTTELNYSLAELGEILPFEPNVADKLGTISITATNIKLKTVQEEFDFAMKRPVFDNLYAYVDGTEYVLESLDGVLYTLDLTTPLVNGATGYIYSATGQQGLRWGYDTAKKTVSLDATDPISFVDSENADGNVTFISFDVVKFQPAPQEKFLGVNGVNFVPSKDEKVMWAENVTIEPQSVVEATLFDLDKVTFDPDFFQLADENTLKYIGRSTNVNLYYNTEMQFVFVESDENPFHAYVDYPNSNTVMLGYGVACPGVSAWTPGWDFNNGIAFRKVPTSEGDLTFTQTIIVDGGYTQFNFYSGDDWGYPVSAEHVTFLDNEFHSYEEEGKPGNFAIEQTSFDNSKWYIYKIVYTVNSEGTAGTFSATKIKEVSK